MAAIHDLLAQVQDQALRERIEKEIERLSKTKKFGLVFEEHLPECTLLYDVPVKRGGTVSKKGEKVSIIYEVLGIKDGVALCINKTTGSNEKIPVKDLITVAQFGDPVYPCIKPVDKIINAPDSGLWHTLIEADNYHALQLLEYLYPGKVDCIYIDPPYNTGARDWKYNNDYVDGADTYRHSKWLSFMEKRLRLAKKLLNPDDSVLIVTIDEKEYLHLGCLLEEVFPEANIQMVSTIINHASVARFNEFNRNNEYVFFVMIGSYELQSIDDSKTATQGSEVAWNTLRRHSPSNVRASRPRQFYPIYINTTTHKIEKIGQPITPDVDRHSVEQIEGCVAVFPVRDNGTEMLWGVIPSELERRLKGGYVKVGKYEPDKPQQFGIQVLPSGPIKQIENGELEIEGYRDDGSIIVRHKDTKKVLPKSQWDYETHDAKTYGSNLLKNIFNDSRFSYPKSVYAVEDALRLFIAHKPNALVVDFFAGSGTTLHALNIMNARDGGNRRGILITNNEVSETEAKQLESEGFAPGDKEWECLGIAQYVTWPRTVCSIKGVNIKGEPLKGTYVGCEREMASGFKANAAFFKLSFLDKNAVALGMQLEQMMPLLWMKAGAVGECPSLNDDKLPMLIFPDNKFAVLIDEKRYREFVSKIEEHSEIDTLFFVTDSEAGYREMIVRYEGKKTYQLYRDYLDNFRINIGR